MHLDAEYSLAQARERDQASNRGPVHGLPFAVKDIMDTADMPTGYGSPIYEGYRPRADAACVAMTRAAGGVLLGKTVTTEFASRHPGKTRNPHDPTHTPGGSSSGSAAAVGDFMAFMAFGTQTLGSVIRPASFCGCVGYKPSYGEISTEGVKENTGSFDTVGAVRARRGRPPALPGGGHRRAGAAPGRGFGQGPSGGPVPHAVLGPGPGLHQGPGGRRGRATRQGWGGGIGSRPRRSVRRLRAHGDAGSATTRSRARCHGKELTTSNC